MHGLRHAYAQQRYQELTGWPSPTAGGPSVKALTPRQKMVDQKARLTVSQELGHERTQIVGIYLGNWRAVFIKGALVRKDFLFPD